MMISCFPWEKSGWLHLYAVPVQGGDGPRTHGGKFEVIHVVFSQEPQAPGLFVHSG